ncbi:MarR family winged helix-turn-helix transcriptional regulator [Candidatus Aquiluna sp. UB-MaderosW2red]|uniref:MarR family winged helix-turn-helix transcriptional regulator n=1 Tax=Candidatus Aquiluna sp. UB-MaderosW2red TaxID=1855377 RepID=UPI000875E484|nr:MarR family winged helix-turn-helix transcriptional regulator [Candidatus Aquiluna sp. UB-MaderosW2red]SCX14841.1 DNA-binding transcriptional regulator, MarR family [Candidatus Aquiluna sp. UB-MaderosW2red]
MATNRITFTLNELVSVLNGAADRLLRANFSLTYSQFLFIVTLEGLGRSTAAHLAESLGVSRAAVSQRLTWFEQRNLIDISRPKGNHKNLSLALTDVGRSLAVSSADFLEKEFRTLFQGLPEVNLGELDSTLKKITSQLLADQGNKIAA